MITTLRQRILCGIALAILITSGNILPVAAEGLQGKRGPKTEYYKLDYNKQDNKLSITAVAGELVEDFKFKQIDEKDHYKVFIPEPKSVKLANRSKGCDSMPTLRWQPPQDDEGNDRNIREEDRLPAIKLFLDTQTGVIKTLVTGEYGDSFDESKEFDDNPVEQFRPENGDKSRDRRGRLYWGEVDPLVRWGVDDEDSIKQKMPKDTGGYTIQRHDKEAYSMKEYRYHPNGNDYTTVHGLLNKHAEDMGFTEEDSYQARIDRWQKLIDEGKVTRHSDDRTDVTLGDDNTLLCSEYNFYEHFWRFIAPYNSTQVRLGPLAGKSLGLPDMPFDEWVKKGDHRLQYQAYKFSGQDAITSVCARKVDTFTCINKLDEIRKKCLAKGIEISGEVTQQDLDNIKSSVWEKDFQKDKFTACILDYKKELIDAEYFSTEEELKVFAEQIVKNAVMPPSLNPEPAEPPVPAAASDKTQCSIGMLSWWMCPVLSFVADINDKVFDILRNWLVLAPFSLTSPGTNDAAYSSWSKVRNLANIAFIFALLYIIYSQITGRAATSGGLRARLPRLIVAILLANMSYVISGIAVDISNIVGDSFMMLLMNTTIAGVSADQYGFWAQIVANITLVGGGAAGTAVVVGSLAALLPIMLIATIAIVGTFIMLLFRQAITILLIVISPLAFAMLALPFTERWFDKWKSTLLQMLYLYPAFALLFAGGNFAAEIIRANAAQTGDTIMTIFSLGVQILPLFAIPYFIKLMSSTLAAVSGKVDQATQGMRDKADRSARDYADYRKTRQRTRALNGRMGVLGYGTFIRMNEQRKAARLNQKSNAHHAAQHLAGSKSEIEKSVNRTVGTLAAEDLREAARRAIQSEEFKAQEEAMEAQLLRVDASDSRDAIDTLTDRAIANANDSSGSNAANIKQVIDSRDVGAIDKLLDNLNKFNEFERKVIVDTIQSSGVANEAAHLGNAENLRAIHNGAATGSAELYGRSAANGDFTPEVMANQSAATISGIAKSYGSSTSGSISEGHFQSIATSYHRATGNQKLNGKIKASTRGIGDSVFTPRQERD